MKFRKLTLEQARQMDAGHVAGARDYTLARQPRWRTEEEAAQLARPPHPDWVRGYLGGYRRASKGKARTL